MKNLLKLLIIIFIFTFIFTSNLSGKINTHIIPIINIEKNSTKTINLDYLVLKNSTFQIKKHPHLNIIHKKNILKITPENNWKGITSISLNASKDDHKINIEIPIIVKQIIYPVKLKHKSEDPKSEIFAAGSFNSWNSKKNKLLYDKKSKSYTNTIFLKSGYYQYKYIINNEWVYDKSNPDKSPDGFSSFNSILKVGEFDKKALTIYPVKKNLYYIYSDNHPNIKKNNIKIFLNNRSNNQFTINKNYLKLTNTKNIKDIKILISKHGYQKAVFHYNIKNDIWQKSIMYFVFTDRFYNGDKNNDRKKRIEEVTPNCDYMGGDFKGITKKINEGYFNKLGIDTIWLSPVNDNPEEFYKDYFPPYKYFGAYHGYWPSSPDKVENHFGTEKDLKELINTAHKKKIKVIFDMVFNHTHTNHPYYKKNPEWYGSAYTPDKKLNLRLFDDYPYTTWFDLWIPSFDYNNTAVEDKMVENALWWIKKYNIDGFRLDAVKHIPVHFWKKLRLAIRKNIEIKNNKLFYMVGESISDRDTINKFIDFDQLDGQFDFPLYFTIKEIFALRKNNLSFFNNAILENQNIYHGIMSAFAGNHDFPRFMAYADGDLPQGSDEKKIGFKADIKVNNTDSYKKIKQAFFCLFTLSEIPLIYYGDEIGLSGAADPDNRRMMKFSRDKISNEQIKITDLIKKLAKIRKKHPPLYKGLYLPVDINIEKNYIIYLKIFFNEVCIAGISQDKTLHNIEFKLPAWIKIKKISNLLSNDKIIYNKKTNTIKIKKFNYFIYSGKTD